jgi:hypothetical protein
VHFILERIDLQFIKKSSLGAINLGVNENDLLGSDDFYLTLDNLSLNTKILEERCVLWIKSSGSWLNPYIIWSNHTWFSWRWSNFLVKDSFDITEITVSENDISVSLKLIENLFNVFVLGPIGTTS